MSRFCLIWAACGKARRPPAQPLEICNIWLTNPGSPGTIEGTRTVNGMAFPSSKILTAKELARTMKEFNQNGMRFCFILGAGASLESGIPSGNVLGMQWMNDLMAPEIGPAEAERRAASLLKDGYIEHSFDEIRKAWEDARRNRRETLPSQYYFDLHRLRFYSSPSIGYRYLEQIMEGRDPSSGYHVLARLLMEQNRNNLVITTNFDNLVEDALSLYMDQKPLVVSHEALAAYITPDVQRPIVAKVHRGLLYEPFNSLETTRSLKDEWKDALRELFLTYTPVVIGYAGGDKSLMSFLSEKSTSLRRGVYWCYLGEPDAASLPEQKIQDFVMQKNGYFVSIKGFDALMLEIGNVFGIDVSPSKTEEHFKAQMNRRLQRYNDQWKNLNLKPETQEAVQSANQEEQRAEKQREKSGTLTAWDHIRRGDRARYNGNFDEAIAEYQKAAEKDPTLSAVHNNWGIAYADQKRYEEAILHYDQAIHLDLNNAKVYNNRGNVYKNMSQYDKAIEDYNRAIELNPDYANAYSNRGNTYDDMEQYDKAIEDYSRAIELNPNDADFYNNRGITYDNIGQYDKAIEDYSRAIELNPDYAMAYYNRGCTYNDMGQYDMAIADYSRAIELNPNYATAYSNRGVAYNRMKQYDKAIADYSKAIELDPNDAAAYNNRGVVYENKGQYDKAVEDYNKAIELNPKYKKAYRNRADAYRALGQEDLAEADEKMAETL